MRLALLSNVTVEVLAGMLRKEHSVWLAPGFGAWMEVSLAPPPELGEFNPEMVFLLLDASHARYDRAAAEEARDRLERAFPGAAVVIPDLEDLADETGGFFDERMWKLGAMPWSLRGLRAIRDEVNRLAAASRTGGKKVLALDFDNTLWSGVIGEDGAGAIVPYREFQSAVKALCARGVLLAGLTRNNPADVEPVWGDPRMVLGREDFAALRIDWNDKDANIADVARELNLGLDSFVFVDDNPAERERMKAMRPEVAVPDFPADASALPAFARRLERLYFPRLRVTAEDRGKTAQYRAESERRRFAAGLSVEDYLKGLEIWADVHPVRADEIPRVAQLSQKTNQFNVLTNRYTPDEIAKFAADPGRLLVAVRAGDRFGDQGLVAFVHVVVDGAEATVADWVMSCRTMNRRLEFAVEDRVEAMLVARGVRTLRASWRRTLKNAPVARLFDGFGFTRVTDGEDAREYVLALPCGRARGACVCMKGADYGII